jgi:hypothetical protein
MAVKVISHDAETQQRPMVDRNLASISCFLRIQTRIGQRLQGIHSKRQALIKTRPKTYKSTGRKYKNKAVYLQFLDGSKPRATVN